MQIFPSVLLHKRLQAILLLRNLTISFHSSCVWILAENWGKRCCPSLPPWVCCVPQALLLPNTSDRSAAQRPFQGSCSSPTAQIAKSVAKPSLSASALCVWVFSRQSCSAAFLWVRDGAERDPHRLLPKPRPSGSPSDFIPSMGGVLMAPRPRDNRSWGKTFVFDMVFGHTATQVSAFHFFKA